MARIPSVKIRPEARAEAEKRVRALRAERARRRRTAWPELAARLDRLRTELALARHRAARAQARIGSTIVAAAKATEEDAAVDRPGDGDGKDAPLAGLDCGLKPARFILETAAGKPLDPKEAHAHVVKALGLARRPNLARVRLAFPRLARRKPALARFLLLELAANRRSLGRARVRVADRLRRRGPFVSVRVEGFRMSAFSGGGGQGFEMDEPDHYDWHLTSPNDDGVDFRDYRGAIDAYGAWGLLGAAAGTDGESAGAGVLIGHPDSGFRVHEDYPANRIDLANAYNAFLDSTTPANFDLETQNVARHPLTPLNLPYFVQHGTYTASAIVAPRHGGDEDVVGVAPGATVLPLRCVQTVVLVGDVEVTAAIEHALDVGVDVISISLGGSPHPSLREALTAAVEDNVIVVAAAGQPQGYPLVHQVVAPANYPEVIAVGGSIGPVPWEGCFSGPEVDICAPAVNVRVARFLSDGRERTFWGAGTSFATAITAGCAALWLQRHGGRQAIADAVPGVPVQQVFRHLLQATAVDPTIFADEPVPGGWNESRFGAGIVNARALLNRGLPAPEDVPPIDDAPPFNVYGTASGLAVFDLNEPWVLATINGALTTIGAFTGAVAELTGTALQAIGDFWSDVADFGAGLVGDAAAWVGGLAGSIDLTFAIAAADDAADALAGAYAAAASATGELGEYLQEQAEAAEEALDEAEDAIDEALEEGEEAVEDFVEDAADFANDAAETATETGAALAGAAADAIGGIFG